MGSVEIVLALVVLATVVAASAGRLGIPAPSLLVLAGLVAGLVPGVPQVRVTLWVPITLSLSMTWCFLPGQGRAGSASGCARSHPVRAENPVIAVDLVSRGSSS